MRLVTRGSTIVGERAVTPPLERQEPIAPLEAAPPRRSVEVVAVLLVLAGAALRVGSLSPLWLDEALSANIASLPLGELLDALRLDGHPPLYYLLLHVWSQLVGAGDWAVRALSGVLGVAALPLVWAAGRRFGGRTCALAALVLYATSPFAIRYATEARMYALVALLVLSGWLAVRRAEERPTIGRLALVSVISGALLLTHYWSLFLLSVVGFGLVVRVARAGRAGRSPGEPLRLVVAVAAGGLLFLPWLPAFLSQAGSTGTPWGAPARPAPVLFTSLADWGGGPYGEATFLGISLALLALLALMGRPTGPSTIDLDLRTRPWARPESIVVVGTLGLAVAGSYASSAAFASRYTSVVHPLVVLLAALGVVVLPRSGLRAAVVGVLAMVGLVFGGVNLVSDRTQAGEIASAIEAGAGPDDLVLYCPDQLGPSTNRLLPDGPRGMTFPEGGDPRFVDWVDYAERVDAADADAFVDAALGRAGDGDIWLVWSGGYRSVEDRCEEVVRTLQEARPGRSVVVESGPQFEHAWLERFAAP